MKKPRKAIFTDAETHAKLKELAHKHNRSMAKELKAIITNPLRE